jgi:hypothetical protein
MNSLKQPEPDLITRVLGEVDFAQRLVGYRYRGRWSSIPADLYSVREVALLLSDKCPAIELDRLEQWLRDTIGDTELADLVAAIVEQSEVNDRERLRQVRALLDERLAQCRAASSV